MASNTAHTPASPHYGTLSAHEQTSDGLPAGSLPGPASAGAHSTPVALATAGTARHGNGATLSPVSGAGAPAGPKCRTVSHCGTPPAVPLADRCRPVQAGRSNPALRALGQRLRAARAGGHNAKLWQDIDAYAALAILGDDADAFFAPKKRSVSEIGAPPPVLAVKRPFLNRTRAPRREVQATSSLPAAANLDAMEQGG